MGQPNELMELFSNFSPINLQNIGIALKKTKISELQELIKGYQINCIGNGNSKIYKITKNGSSEPFILKLEAWSMPKEIADRFQRNSKINKAVAPVYWSGACNVGNQKLNIQIQPFCVGGTIESVSLASMTEVERLNKCQKIFLQVTEYYSELEKENILFPDGKPSNFTLNEKEDLALTDMKTPVDANQSELQNCPQINTESYPLYIPIPPPRELSKIHSRHIGINLYSFLSGSRFTDLYFDPALKNNKWIPKPVSFYNFDKPIFDSEAGKLYVSLIKSTLSDKPTNRPDANEIQQALKAIDLISKLSIQLEKDPTNENLRTSINAATNEFHIIAKEGRTYQSLVTHLIEITAQLREQSSKTKDSKPIHAQENKHQEMYVSCIYKKKSHIEQLFSNLENELKIIDFQAKMLNGKPQECFEEVKRSLTDKIHNLKSLNNEVSEENLESFKDNVNKIFNDAENKYGAYLNSTEPGLIRMLKSARASIVKAVVTAGAFLMRMSNSIDYSIIDENFGPKQAPKDKVREFKNRLNKFISNAKEAEIKSSLDQSQISTPNNKK